MAAQPIVAADRVPGRYGGPLTVTTAGSKLVRGTVVETHDPHQLGRLRVVVPGLTGLKGRWSAPSLLMLVGKEESPVIADEVWVVVDDPDALVVAGRCSL